MNKAAQDNRGPQPRRLAVCADDFGLHPSVNAAVFDLVARGRLSTVACMVDGPAWADGAARWRAERTPAVELGLHLDLTERFAGAGARWDWNRLVVTSGLRLLDRRRLQAEIERQLDAFERGLQCAPDFVDGHRHVHQLPQVREALVEALQRRYPGQRPWLRRCVSPAAAGERFKTAVIGLLGAQRLSALAAQAGLPQNRYLLGVYGFDGDAASYERRLAGWLACAQDGDLLMCHPGLAGAGDGIADARSREHAVLAGPGFGRLLSQNGLHISPLAPPI
jgi:predicted glycoside hydrolase/deacetylase ChbG (UPF0249 family)